MDTSTCMNFFAKLGSWVYCQNISPLKLNWYTYIWNIFKHCWYDNNQLNQLTFHMIISQLSYLIPTFQNYPRRNFLNLAWNLYICRFTFPITKVFIHLLGFYIFYFIMKISSVISLSEFLLSSYWIFLHVYSQFLTDQVLNIKVLVGGILTH